MVATDQQEATVNEFKSDDEARIAEILQNQELFWWQLEVGPLSSDREQHTLQLTGAQVARRMHEMIRTWPANTIYSVYAELWLGRILTFKLRAQMPGERWGQEMLLAMADVSGFRSRGVRLDTYTVFEKK